ncbi:MAG TPA: 6-phosphogluconolactonase [Ktedonobacterales bacterium]|jgi:6-phosphogluconolactonase
MTAPAPGSPSIRVFDDLNSLADAAAQLFVAAATASVKAKGSFFVALSGGSTPRTLYTLLAQPPYHDQVNWSRARIFWGDERCVPPTDAESNYRMARESLLFHVPVSSHQVYRMPGEAADPNAGAALYEMALRRAFALAPGQLPRFDLILLGMGPDGHTASLFPHTAALGITNRLVVANRVEKLHTTRLTLTYPAINAAALVVFLVAGADKADALAAVLQGPRQPEELPSQGVAPANGAVIWLVDRAAAARLAPPPA